jgi:hypothetical protein
VRCPHCGPSAGLGGEPDHYWCCKRRGGLDGNGGSPEQLNEFEQYLTGMLPKAPPGRSLNDALKELYVSETSYEARARGITWVVELDGQRWELSV